MTPEEKARAYDEALKRVKNLENTTTEEEALIKYIFPELRESEDERIIKFLKHSATLDAADELFQEYRVKHTQVIAWLEKQKECFAAISNTSVSEDERIRKEIIDFIQWAEDRGMTRHDYHQAKRPAVWLAYLEKQKEQMQEVEDDLDKEIHRFFDDCIDVYEAKLYGNVSERVIPVDCYELIARHFAEWGKKQN